MFLRRTKQRRAPIPVTMTGVRMGERLLQIGVDDPVMLGAIAAKVGLSGTAAVVVADEASAGKAREAAAGAGVLMDVHAAGLAQLPYPAGSFDVIVLHGVRGPLASGAVSEQALALHECRRVLRRGGRIIAIQAGARVSALDGLKRLLGAAPVRPEAGPAADSAVAVFEAAGFRPVRVIGELEGFKFTEGLNS